MGMPSKGPFDRKLFRFLKDLEANNDRQWFEANKGRYIEEVREPILAFIGAFGPRLHKISKHIVADPRPTGGSMFRIYRDTRFSKDKTPYKTYASAQFRHEEYKNAYAPCFYLHLQPGGSFAGAGLWHPDTDSTRKIRAAIVDKTAEWKRVTQAPAWRALCTLQGDSLQRPPRGFDPEHECIEDIKRKDFIAVTSYKDAEVCSADFMSSFVKFCRTNNKWMHFLTRAVGVAW
jgi:uncharacterized protein (TIGR02453 family)